MAEYLLLIVGNDDAYQALTEEQGKEMYAGHSAFMDAVRAAGVKLGPSAELAPPAGARTLHADGLVTDGPFAEAKEQVGGYYTIDVPTIEDAVEWARKIPLLPGDKIEVRLQK
ncbi:MAG TPA: YciI family protein [Mycobacteriales bacterium]|nr:YciI family protein [Mycobacteriales bacterium]